jgi:hypothetical protein
MSLNKRLFNEGAAPLPTDAFKIVTYSGNSSSQNIDVGFQPKVVWIVSRNTAGRSYYNFHKGNDFGNNGFVYLFPPSNQALESSAGFNHITDGFSMQSSFGWNHSGITYVAFCWGGPLEPTTNTSGGITSYVSAKTDANQTSGFFNGNAGASTKTIAHGLSVAPEVIWQKDGESTTDWNVFTNTNGTNYRLHLNTSDAATTENSTYTATSTKIENLTGTAGLNSTDKTMYFWAWRALAGYSDFGLFSGNNNGSNNATNSITLGFQPDFVIVKSLSSDNWRMYDSVTNGLYYPNLSNQTEATNQGHLRFDSNGFTMLTDNSNFTGHTIFYMAWKQM